MLIFSFALSLDSAGKNWYSFRRHDTQHNGTQHNEIQHNDTQHNDIRHIYTQHKVLVCDVQNK
jgi:hypothetical protein